METWKQKHAIQEYTHAHVYGIPFVIMRQHFSPIAQFQYYTREEYNEKVL